MNPFHTNFKQYLSVAVKELASLSVRRLQTFPSMSANALQRILTLLGPLVLKVYVNAIQSPVHYYQITKNFLVVIGD